MTDVTAMAQAGYRGDSPAPAYSSSPNGMAYIAGMAHRLNGGAFPSQARMGRGYTVHVNARSYNTISGADCQEARLVMAGSRWAIAQASA